MAKLTNLMVELLNEEEKKQLEKIQYRKEYYQRNKLKISAYFKQYVKQNSEQLKEKRKIYEAKNREKINKRSLEQQKRAFAENPEKVREARRRRKKALKAKDPKKFNEIQRKANLNSQKRMVTELQDCYIKQLLTKHAVTGALSAKDIPQELVETKRLEIKIRRFVNEKCK